jgi:hypothetical protein
MLLGQKKYFEQTELLQGIEKIYLISCMSSHFNFLIKLNQHIFNLSRIVTKNDYFFCPEVPLPLCGPALPHREEVSSPKKQ